MVPFGLLTLLLQALHTCCAHKERQGGAPPQSFIPTQQGLPNGKSSPTRKWQTVLNLLLVSGNGNGVGVMAPTHPP